MPPFRTYTIRVRTGPQAGVHQYRAPEWAKAFAWALEEFPQQAVGVDQWYWLVESACGKQVVSELDLPNHAGCTQAAPPVSARSWLEAKSLLGLTLSPEQVRCLEVQRRVWGDI